MKRVIFLCLLVSVVFTCRAQLWTDAGKTVASDRMAQDNYGSSVSIDGNYAIVSACLKDHYVMGIDSPLANAGAAYILEKDANGNWIEVQKLVASDLDVQDIFGAAVCIQGNVAAISALWEDEDEDGLNRTVSAGSVYIFERDAGGIWNEVQKIVPSDRGISDYFGSAIAMDGNFMVIGVNGEGFKPSGGVHSKPNAGVAYIFERDAGGTWNEVQRIEAPERQYGDHFGSAADISGDYLIIGAFFEDEDEADTNTLIGSGSAYIFERNSSGTWILAQKIVASDRDIGDSFGSSVAMQGNTAVVGAYQEDDDMFGFHYLLNSGSAYVFERDGGGTWNQTQKLVASDREAADWFGGSITMDGDYLVIGASGDDGDISGGSATTNTGSAYVFKRNSSGDWNEIQKLLAPDRDGDEHLCFPRYSYQGVSISGNQLVASAIGEDRDESGDNPLTTAGAAYFFELSSGVTGVESDATMDVSTYPNPVKDQVVIEFGEALSGVHILVSNPIGNTILEKSMESGDRVVLDLSGPAAGLYLINITTDAGFDRSLKVVKSD